MSDVSVDLSKSDSLEEAQEINIDEVSHLDSEHLKIIDRNLESDSSDIVQEQQRKRKHRKIEYEYDRPSFPSVTANASDFASDEEGDVSIIRPDAKETDQITRTSEDTSSSENDKKKSNISDKSSKNDLGTENSKQSTDISKEESFSKKELYVSQNTIRKNVTNATLPVEENNTNIKPKKIDKNENCDSVRVLNSYSDSVSISISKSSSSLNIETKSKNVENENNDKNGALTSKTNEEKRSENKTNQSTKELDTNKIEGYVVNCDAKFSSTEKKLGDGSYESSDEPAILEPNKINTQIAAELGDAVNKEETQSSCCILI